MQRLFAVSGSLVLTFLLFLLILPPAQAQEKDIGTAWMMHHSLIYSAKDYISAGQNKLAEKDLDKAAKLADQEKDSESLQEIGDLYLSIGLSLKDKAEDAWHKAGYWRSQGY
jgi:hypothetical protein